MQLRATIKIAWNALWANKVRSILTVLGIVIGILAIVLVVALGNGAQNLILNEFQSIGATAVIVRPGRQPTGPADFADTLFSQSLVQRDIDALSQKQNVANVLSVNPAVLIPGAVSYQDAVYRPTTFGWTAYIMKDLLGIEPSEGEYFTDGDVREKAKVAVIGATVKEKLFGTDDAIGKFIKVKNHNIKVVGVFPKRGQVSFFNVDELVLVPYTTAQQTILGINYVHEVFVRADTEENIDFVVADIKATLRETHGITDPAKDDFFVNTQKNAVESISTVTKALTIFLVAIASIALVVGGIGIMNIMLVSVTERTAEIGLRKALGATNKDIMRQFLAESVLLTLSGGVIGTLLAITLAALAAFIIRQQFNLNWQFQMPVAAIIIGVTVATAVGVIFGLYPARKAAQRDPIASLRYE